MEQLKLILVFANAPHDIYHDMSLHRHKKQPTSIVHTVEDLEQFVKDIMTIDKETRIVPKAILASEKEVIWQTPGFGLFYAKQS